MVSVLLVRRDIAGAIGFAATSPGRGEQSIEADLQKRLAGVGGNGVVLVAVPQLHQVTHLLVEGRVVGHLARAFAHGRDDLLAEQAVVLGDGARQADFAAKLFRKTHFVGDRLDLGQELALGFRQMLVHLVAELPPLFGTPGHAGLGALRFLSRRRSLVGHVSISRSWLVMTSFGGAAVAASATRRFR